MNLQGKVKTINPIILRGAKNFKTRTIILDRTTSYEGKENINHTEITLLGDRADLPEQLQLQPGDFIKCDFNIEGKFFEYNGEEKFSQDVKVWKIEVVSKGTPPTSSQPANATKEDMP